MKALVIYNEIPDRIRFFLLQDPRVDEVLMLENLQGVIVNVDDLTEMQDASLEMFLHKVDGGENRIPEWPVATDSEIKNLKEQLKNAVETSQPDRIFLVSFIS